MPDSTLPSGFQDLEPFVARWSLATERERHATRLASEMDDLQAFYDALQPRMEALVDHLNTRDLGALDVAEQRLLQLGLSYIEASLAVEAYGEPTVTDGFEPSRFHVWF